VWSSDRYGASPSGDKIVGMERQSELSDVAVLATSPYAAVHETHSGDVALIGDKAYKVKKPVMRRHPDSRRLATMVMRGLPIKGELADIARVLARFHAEADRGRHINSQAKVSNLSARWQEQLSELQRFAVGVAQPDLIQRVEHLASQYIGGRAVLFAQRISDGHIVDGHGDLLAKDIFCLPDGPVLLDCLVSDDHLRFVDCVDDAACLAMDLEFLGRKDLADHFLDCYRRYSDDPAPPSLKDFYIAYRAVVQAKADRVRFSQGTLDAASDASRHLSLAIEHLTAGTVHLALIGGGPGTGKTALARSLAERVGADVISTDEIQHDLEQSNSITAENDLMGDGWCAAHSVLAVHEMALRRAHPAGQRAISDPGWRMGRSSSAQTGRGARHRDSVGTA
jgi:aminoglycoside phosphotransferase family enzyme